MLFELLVKEGALIGLLGLGPAVALGRRMPLAARLAFAPAFGLAVGPALLLTVNVVLPLETALWWLYLPAAAVSTAVGVRALRREGFFHAVAPRSASRRCRWRSLRCS